MMQWQNVWWLVIITTCYGTRILDSLESHSPQLSWNKMNELVKLCFSERINHIVITADLVNTISGITQDLDHLNMNIIDHKYKSKQTHIFNPAYPTYILSADSSYQLKTLLHALKLSPTWNITSVFFIIGINEKSCRKASRMLQIFWKLDLISAFYVCYESDNNETMILNTYNPFTNRAPEPWVKEESANRPDNRWTLFRQPYTRDYQVCKSLTYDKTKSLDGYSVRATGESRTNASHHKFYGIDSLENYLTNDFEKIFFKNLFATMNVTSIIQYGDPGIWVNDTAYGILTTMINRTNDISLNPRYLDEYPHVDMLKPHREAFSLILTQPVYLVVNIKNFAHFLNPAIIGITVVILLMTFVIFIFNNNCDYSYGCLEIIRMLTSAGVISPLDKLSIRIIFLTTTLYVFFMSPAIQGQIFSNSAIPDSHYPRSLKDLHDFKFNVYYYFKMKDFLAENELWRGSNRKYLHPMSHLSRHCHKQVLDDSSNACLTPMNYQYQSIKKHRGLHLAKMKIDIRSMSYWIKKDWVLKDKVNKLTTTYSESGFFYLWENQASQVESRKLNITSRLKGFEVGFDEINFESLLFIYAFIILSFVFSIFIFVSELTIAKYRADYHKKMIIQTLEQKVKYVNGRIVLRK